VGPREGAARKLRSTLMGNRTLRRASVAALIQAFENVADEEKAERDAARTLHGHHDLNDFSEQVQLLEKMGPLTAEEIPGLAAALPGVGSDPGIFFGAGPGGGEDGPFLRRWVGH
jgi:signal recognition particle GTPase